MLSSSTKTGQAELAAAVNELNNLYTHVQLYPNERKSVARELRSIISTLMPNFHSMQGYVKGDPQSLRVSDKFSIGLSIEPYNEHDKEGALVVDLYHRETGKKLTTVTIENNGTVRDVESKTSNLIDSILCDFCKLEKSIDISLDEHMIDSLCFEFNREKKEGEVFFQKNRIDSNIYDQKVLSKEKGEFLTKIAELLREKKDKLVSLSQGVTVQLGSNKFDVNMYLELEPYINNQLVSYGFEMSYRPSSNGKPSGLYCQKVPCLRRKDPISF